MTNFNKKIPVILFLFFTLSGCAFTVMQPAQKHVKNRGEKLDIKYMRGQFTQVTKEYNNRGKKSTYRKTAEFRPDGHVIIEEEFSGKRNVFFAMYVIVDDFLILRNRERDEYPELYYLEYIDKGFELERVSGALKTDSFIEEKAILGGKWTETQFPAGNFNKPLYY